MYGRENRIHHTSEPNSLQIWLAFTSQSTLQAIFAHSLNKVLLTRETIKKGKHLHKIISLLSSPSACLSMFVCENCEEGMSSNSNSFRAFFGRFICHAFLTFIPSDFQEIFLLYILEYIYMFVSFHSNWRVCILRDVFQHFYLCVYSIAFLERAWDEIFGLYFWEFRSFYGLVKCGVT